MNLPNNNYYNYYLNNNDNFCKFNCSPYLFFLMPFYSTREFDNNLLFNNMQMTYNKCIQYNNIMYNNNLDNDSSIDKYQESNSSSHLSTTSDGGQLTSSGNFNQKIFNDEKKMNRDMKNLDESIKTGIKAIEDYYDSIESLGDVANLACFYYCYIDSNPDNNFFIKMEVQKLADNYNNMIGNNKKCEEEFKSN